jgi:hypothetical protein
VIDREQREDKVGLTEPGSLIVDTDEDLGDILLRSLFPLGCRRLSDVDRRKPVVGNRMRAIEVPLS